jgi:hypothetical protein
MVHNRANIPKNGTRRPFSNKIHVFFYDFF